MKDSETAHHILAKSVAKGDYAHRADRMLQAREDSIHSVYALAEKSGIPLVDIESIKLNPEVIKLIDEQLLTKHQVLPLFQRSNCLFIAISDPTKQSALDEIKSHTNMQTEAILVEADKLESFIKRAISASDINMHDLGDDIVDDRVPENNNFSANELAELSEDNEFSHYLETFSQEENLSTEDEEESTKEQLSPEEEFSHYLDELSGNEEFSPENETVFLDEKSQADDSIQEKSPQPPEIISKQSIEFNNI